MTRKAPLQVPVSEDEVQRAIIGALQVLRYEVLQTSRRRTLATCPKCSQRFRPAGGDGASKGVPDLIVTHAAWPAGVWLGLEVKGPSTKVSPEQADLAKRGRYPIVRSVREALDFVKAQDAFLRELAREIEVRLAGGH